MRVELVVVVMMGPEVVVAAEVVGLADSDVFAGRGLEVGGGRD